jgi:hypothetical protein
MFKTEEKKEVKTLMEFKENTDWSPFALILKKFGPEV